MQRNFLRTCLKNIKDMELLFTSKSFTKQALALCTGKVF
jgi:hypothetical protein